MFVCATIYGEQRCILSNVVRGTCWALLRRVQSDGTELDGTELKYVSAMSHGMYQANELAIRSFQFISAVCKSVYTLHILQLIKRMVLAV